MKLKNLQKFTASIFTVTVLAIALFFLSALSNVDREKALEEKSQLEQALRNAAVSCYAIEGAYPPSADYLIENYRIVINSQRFTVKYELISSNLMPDITVLENNYEE
ncbi:MAG: hypothetical protein E7646_00855 [Ruminococcaceae bacterium]|nr:hypothetical protein [Oscillospiraceae bacterium]